MADSAVLRGEAQISVFPGGAGEAERLDKAFPSSEVTRGFSVLLRQFHSHKELACFNAAQAILRGMNDRAQDDGMDARLEQLDAWGKAERRLRAYPLKVLVGQRLREEDRWSGPVPGEVGVTPELLMSVFNYGENIHWRKQRHRLAEWREDDFNSASKCIGFLEASAGLAHLYLGFSRVVARALGEN
jgi:hypothetical protein